MSTATHSPSPIRAQAVSAVTWPFPVPAARHGEDFKRLERLLHRPGHFSLILAQCNAPLYRDALIAAADASGERPPAAVWTLPESGDSHLLHRGLAEHAAGASALHLVGLDRWLAQGSEPLLRDINYRREGLAAVARLPLVLWMAPEQVRGFAEQAPDLWAWRAAVLDFAMESDDRPATTWESAFERSPVDADQARNRLARLDAHLHAAPVTGTTPDLLLDAAAQHAALGDWDQARARAGQALGHYRAFGNDRGAAAALERIAAVLEAAGRLAEAEPPRREALALGEGVFGPDHPRVATGLNNLAMLLRATNRLAEAEPLMRRALAIDEASLGPDHPKVAADLNNLAQLLKSTGRLAAAEPLMRRALAIVESNVAPDHPSVASVLNNLAALLLAAGRLAEAEPTMRRALAIDEASFGPNDPKVAIRLNNLAQLLAANNRLAEAEPLMRRALTIDEASLGPDHPDVATDLNNLARLLQDTARFAEAEPLMRRAVLIWLAFARDNGHAHPHLGAGLASYRALLAALDPDPTVVERRIASLGGESGLPVERWASLRATLAAVPAAGGRGRAD